MTDSKWLIFGREPVRWVGIILTLILALVGTLMGEGVISEALGGRITDIANQSVEIITGILVLVGPLIATEIARRGATAALQPKLAVGTPVLVDRPDGLPDDSPPPDAVVALRSQLKNAA